MKDTRKDRWNDDDSDPGYEDLEQDHEFDPNDQSENPYWHQYHEYDVDQGNGDPI